MNSTKSEGLKKLPEYFKKMNETLEEFLSKEENIVGLNKAVEIIAATKDTKATIYLVGNGGSSAIAEHMAVDFTKNAGLKAQAISGTPMLTTFSNDYGYEYVFSKILERFANKGDVLFAISSSGQSKNILNACEAARAKGMFVITLSAFNADNPLRSAGDINFWLDSKAYGFVELLHNTIIHYVNDSVIGAIEYVIN